MAPIVTVVADTGAMVALGDRTDQWHPGVFDWFATGRATVHVPISVVQEGAFLVGARRGASAEAQFVRRLLEGFVVESLEERDLVRSAELIETYADLPLGFVDATVVAVAERLEAVTIFTTDRRHFGVVRPAHCPRFVLAPMP